MWPCNKNHLAINFITNQGHILLDWVATKDANNSIDKILSRYNQITLSPQCQRKIAFATELESFAYKQMSFRLKNGSSLVNEVEFYVHDLCCKSTKGGALNHGTVFRVYPKRKESNTRCRLTHLNSTFGINMLWYTFIFFNIVTLKP